MWIAGLSATVLIATTAPAHAARQATTTANAVSRPTAATARSRRRLPIWLNGTLLSGAVIAPTLVWGYDAWWRGKQRVPFHWRRTGAFGADTYAGGSDKTGHTYSMYLGTLILDDLYNRAGFTGPAAVGVAAAVVFLLGNGIEALDARTDYGFEYGDVIANTIGISTAVLSLLCPKFYDAFNLRISYWPSDLFLKHTRKDYLTLINDYSGMIVYADFNTAGLFRMFNATAPPVLRHTLFGLNWNTHDYSPGTEPGDRPAYKQRLLGIDIGANLPEIFTATMRDTKGRRALTTFTRYYAVPFTVLSFARDLDHKDWLIHFGVGSRFQIR